MKTATCRGCGVPILWALAESGARVPLDLISALPKYPKLQVPSPLPEFSRYQVNLDDPRDPWATKDPVGPYLSHFITCPDRAKFSSSSRRLRKEDARDDQD